MEEPRQCGRVEPARQHTIHCNGTATIISAATVIAVTIAIPQCIGNAVRIPCGCASAQRCVHKLNAETDRQETLANGLEAPEHDTVRNIVDVRRIAALNTNAR